MADPVHDEVERVARLSYGRLVAVLARRTGSVDAAADALAGALVRALETWPSRGIPERPEAWLVATARNLASDAGRRRRLAGAAEAHLVLLEEERSETGDGPTPDPTLNLMLACAHPAIDERMRTPLMLQLVLGLDARRMAGAFLIPPGTLGQRLTRARAKIEAARIGFSMPGPDEIEERIGRVLDAIYVAYTVGSDTGEAGDAKGASLAREALWLARLVCARLPRVPEAQALLALMLFAAARRPARLDARGRFVPLSEQDPSLWDTRLLEEADIALRAAAERASLGRYQLEAAIQAAHAARRTGRPVGPDAIVGLYRGLVALHPSTGALCGLAAALGEAGEPDAGLAVLEEVEAAHRERYQPWWATRAELARRLGDDGAAAAAYDRAMALTGDVAVRDFLRARRDAASGAPRA